MNTVLNPEEISELIRKCGRGDEESLRTFFETYSKDIYNFPMKVFHLSEDDAGDFYIYAFEKLKSGKRFKSFEGKSQFRTWFYSVLRNLLIDWQRTKREISTIDRVRKNFKGEEFGGVEEEPDQTSEEKSKALEISKIFQRQLMTIKLESRVVFKLTFIYYLHLEDDEIKYILEKSGMDTEKLKNWILSIRSELSEKAMEIQKLEDKITSLYLSILDLKNAKLVEESLETTTTNLPNLDKIGKAIKKKYDQRQKLLEKKQKGLFLARTPYKEIGNILGISEGNVSVTVSRVIEKLQKKIQLE